MHNNGLAINTNGHLQASASLEDGTAPSGESQVVLIYRRDASPDEELMRFLEKELTAQGISVFVDRHLTLGVEWAKEIEKRIRTADAVIPLLSAESVTSEMLGFEIENAHEASQEQGGRPIILPVRVSYTGPLPEPLAGILDPIQYLLWEGPQDDLGLITELLNAIQRLSRTARKAETPSEKGTRLTPVPPARKPSQPSYQPVAGRPLAFESIGGAVPINSDFYLPRPADAEMQTSVSQQDSIILIKGARQMGKTSLMARGLHFARRQGMRVAFVDFQKLNAAFLNDANSFYLTLAESLVDQLELSVLPSEVWDPRRGPNVNFERFMRREVLAKLGAPLVWGMDEVDRLFVCPFGSEVFGLFRSWHNERALDPSGPWSGLTMLIAYATEAHLFITDMNQSPFNVGTRLALDDFTPVQVTDLNRRYGHPLKTEADLNRLTRLVGGHPYLVRRGLHEFATHKMTMDSFEYEAPRDEGLYGDHLRRILVLLAKDPALTEVVRDVLRDKPCPTQESFYRLRSAGVIRGNTPADVRPRCRLYGMFLKRHLLG